MDLGCFIFGDHYYPASRTDCSHRRDLSVTRQFPSPLCDTPLQIFLERTRCYRQRQRARVKAAEPYAKDHEGAVCWGFANLRVHDLKHTFGRRLRAVGIPLETRKVLLGHRNGDITSHYSAPELEELLEAANRVCAVQSRKSHAMTLLKRKTA